MTTEAHETAGVRPVIVPILPVRSLDEAERLHETMGLQVERYDDGYAWVRIQGHEIWHLRLVEGLDPDSNPTSIYVFIEELDATHRGLVEAGLVPTPIVDTPWGMRETSVRDPSGNLVRLGCSLNPSTESDGPD